MVTAADQELLARRLRSVNTNLDQVVATLLGEQDEHGITAAALRALGARLRGVVGDIEDLAAAREHAPQVAASPIAPGVAQGDHTADTDTTGAGRVLNSSMPSGGMNTGVACGDRHAGAGPTQPETIPGDAAQPADDEGNEGDEGDEEDGEDEERLPRSASLIYATHLLVMTGNPLQLADDVVSWWAELLGQAPGLAAELAAAARAAQPAGAELDEENTCCVAAEAVVAESLVWCLLSGGGSCGDWVGEFATHLWDHSAYPAGDAFETVLLISLLAIGLECHGLPAPLYAYCAAQLPAHAPAYARVLSEIRICDTGQSGTAASRRRACTRAGGHGATGMHTPVGSA